MTIETPYRDFLAFWAAAEHASRDEQERLWEELYIAPHRALMEHYLALFGAGASLAAALPRFGEVAGSLDARYAGLRLKVVSRQVAELLDAPEAPRAIAMVGLFTADAWADEFEDGPAAFFALERLPRPGVSATHELTHVSHRLAHGERWEWEPGLALLNEGIATLATRTLHPEVPLEVHFLVDDYPAWEAAAEADWPGVVDTLIGCLASSDPHAMQRFFWPDWGRSKRDVPERVGYLVGARVVDVLLRAHDLAAIVRWPARRALPEVRAALEALR